MTAIAVCLLIGFLAWRVERLVRPLVQKKAAALEAQTAIEERRGAAPPAPDPMPGDLLALADKESEPWAREQTLKALRESYEATGDWGQVKHHAVTNILSGRWPRP